MRSHFTTGSSFTTASTALRQLQSPRERTRGLLPYRLIGGIAAGADVGIILAVSVLTGIGYHLAFLDRIGSIENFLAIGALSCVNFLAILVARGDYRAQNLANLWKQVRETTITWIFVFFVLFIVGFSFKISETYSRGAILAFFAVGWFAILAWRLAIARFIAYAFAEGAFVEQRIILLADEEQLNGSEVIEKLERCGYEPVKTFAFTRDPVCRNRYAPSQLADSVGEIIEISRREPIEGVFLLLSWNDRHLIEQLMESLRVMAIPIYLLPDQNVSHFLGSRFVNIGTAYAAELQRGPLTTMEQIYKRALDVLIASVLLACVWPLMVLVAVLLKFESHRAILFAQQRNGFNGRPFKMWKFRTMNVVEDGAVIRQVTKNDSRVTRLGRVLRRANIDELPQLFNVIAGDMSIVGPRPHAAAHNSEYAKIIENYAFRHHMKPGLTGWAQVNGLRGETQTVDLMVRRVEFDLWYINNWSLWLDFKILLRTLILGLQSTAY